MTKKTILQDIVNDEVNRRCKTQKDFYTKVLKVSQQSWNRWKNGEHGFSSEKMNQIEKLFTPYEWMLVKRVVSDMSSYSSNFETKPGSHIYKNTPYEVYQSVKLAIAKEWANNNAGISVNSAFEDYSGNPYKRIGTQLTVGYGHKTPLVWNNSDVLTFNISLSSAEVPVGRENRIEWFNEHFEDVII